MAETTPECVKCPVCGHSPQWMPSMTQEAESIGCNWDSHCPEVGSYDFTTDYLPVSEAVSKWNAAVADYKPNTI